MSSATTSDPQIQYRVDHDLLPSPARSTPPTQPSPLLSLPLEIRLEIFKRLFQDEEVCIKIPVPALSALVVEPITITPPPHVRPATNASAILQTSRKVHSEGIPFFHTLVCLCVIDLRSGTNDARLAHFSTIRLVNPLIPWEDLARAQLLRVRHLIIDKGEVYWGDLGIDFSDRSSLDESTSAHRGADNAVNAFMIRLWVNKMSDAMAQMRGFARQRQIGQPQPSHAGGRVAADEDDLSLTMNFCIRPREDATLLASGQLRRFSLVLSENEVFTLRYTSKGEEYVVRQKKLGKLHGL